MSDECEHEWTVARASVGGDKPNVECYWCYLCGKSKDSIEIKAQVRELEAEKKELEAYLDALERGFTEPWRDDFEQWKKEQEHE